MTRRRLKRMSGCEMGSTMLIGMRWELRRRRRSCGVALVVSTGYAKKQSRRRWAELALRKEVMAPEVIRCRLFVRVEALHSIVFVPYLYSYDDARYPLLLHKQKVSHHLNLRESLLRGGVAVSTDGPGDAMRSTPLMNMLEASEVATFWRKCGDFTERLGCSKVFSLHFISFWTR